MNTFFRLDNKLLTVDDLLDQQLRTTLELQRDWDRNVPVSVQEDEWQLYREAA